MEKIAGTTTLLISDGRTVAAAVAVIVFTALFALAHRRPRVRRRRRGTKRRTGTAQERGRRSREKGAEFERYCAGLLRKNGYENVRLTGRSGDMGGDIVAEKWGKKFVIQCKNYTGNVGVEAVQQALAAKAVYNCDEAVVMASTDMTDSAKKLAQRNNVILWDWRALNAMK